MAIINLRDFYPFYKDCTVDVPDDVAAVLHDAERLERNYIRRMFWNKAHYSLDVDDGIEHDALFVSVSPCEMYERKLTMEQLYAAIESLPDKQNRRVYAHFILGITQTEIARAEGVSESAVCISICKGLKNMEKFLKNFS